MRRDKGVKRGPVSSAFTHLTGEPEPSDAEMTDPPPALDIHVSLPDMAVCWDIRQSGLPCLAEFPPNRAISRLPQPSEVERVVEETERLAWRCQTPGRRKARLARLDPPGQWVQLVRSSSEAESGDEAAQLQL